MPGAQRALAHEALHVGRKLEQPHQVGDVRAALAQALGQPLLGVAEAVHQLAVARRLLDRVEIGALDVLDDGDLEDLVIGQIAHHHGQLVEPRHPRRPPAPLARHDLVHRGVARRGPHEQRLDHALGADRGGEVRERRLVEAPARLVGVGRDAVHRQGAVWPARRRLLGRLDVGHQRGQAPAEAALALAPPHATSSRAGSTPARRISSAARSR